jgi:4-nitrophenyl phosphatase
LKGIILDIDGVLRRGKDPIPGSIEAVEGFLEKGISVCYLTNNSTRTRDDMLSSLMEMGFPECLIITSAEAAADFILIERSHSRCLVVPVYAGQVTGKKDFDFVVAGLDRGLTYDKIKDAMKAIRKGAIFIATNNDPTLPIEGGEVVPGAGATIAAIMECTGVDPIIIGKPEPFSTRLALSKMGLDPEDVLMVGDRVDTDIAAGLAAGCDVAMVLTGDVKEVKDTSFPVYQDLNELFKSL